MLQQSFSIFAGLFEKLSSVDASLLSLLCIVKEAIRILRRNALKCPAVVPYLGCKNPTSLPFDQLLILEAKVRTHGHNIY